MPFESAQGITFKFNNVTYTATSIVVSKSAGEFNVTSTDIPKGTTCRSRYRAGGLMTIDVKVDWIGNTPPPVDGVYSIDFGGVDLHGGENISGGALCTGLSITAQAGDLIKGSATFKVSYD